MFEGISGTVKQYLSQRHERLLQESRIFGEYLKRAANPNGATDQRSW